ncbi:MAG: DUF4198 domain-containing protein [Planctomycetaceae bacterium]|nr:DUF4198 domain-containing protein [Planctomycetaceae bacterium]
MSRCAFLFLFLLVFVLGCYPSGRNFPSQFVEGIVTLDGKPVPKAIVTFQPKTPTKESDVATGSTDNNGRFTLTSSNGDPGKGALEGDYIVLVSLLKVTPLDKPVKVPGTPIMTTTEVKQLLPTIYQDKTKTPLAATVKKRKNKFTFELKSNP